MKTKFFTITMVFLFALTAMAEATSSRPENLSVASRHESNTVLDMISNDVLYDSALLDEWISSRETWEQEGQEMESNNAENVSQILEEWVTGRENWENEGSETDRSFPPFEPSLLDEWNSSNQNWEQR
jgi:hypothetical protein